MTTEQLSREDLHERINKRNFDPAEVEVVGYMDTRPPILNADALFGLPKDMYDIIVSEFQQHRTEWLARNVELFGREYPGSRCEHCGAHIRWAGIVRYTPTGQHFIVGEICAEERMSLSNRGQHDARLVKMAAEHQAEMLRIAEAKATFYREHAAEAEYLFNEDRPYNDFMADLRDKLQRYGSLSDKQVACITRNIERDAERQARFAEREAKLADVPALAEGRYEITGTVRSTKWQENQFGGALKMLVEFDDGNRVWGTVPKALGWDGLEDRRVAFTAKVERSKDDEHFGFYSRPTGATYLDEEN
jgi:hypothetical protein